MSKESDDLRAGIRFGDIQCRCGRPDGIHRMGCFWVAAVNRIYEIERAEESQSDTEGDGK